MSPTADAAVPSPRWCFVGVVVGLVPYLFEQLIAAHPGRVYRESKQERCCCRWPEAARKIIRE